MRVIVVTAYGPYSVGHVFTDMPANQARTLIARGLVSEEAAQTGGEKAMRSPVDRMMRPADVETKRTGGRRQQRGML